MTTPSPAELPQLVLYYFPSCTYCGRVRRAAARLGLELELRDVHADDTHARELEEGAGHARVPALRVLRAGAEDEWLTESGDIVRWLQEYAGEGAPRSSVIELFLGVPTTLTMWSLLFVGIVFPEVQSPSWLAACSVAAARSAASFKTSRAWWHAMLGGVFSLAAVSIALRWAGLADLPWWWAAYAAVAVLAIATLVLRVRVARARRASS